MMNAKQRKHFDVIVGYLVRDDQKQAIRHYVENRVSFSVFNEAKAYAQKLVRTHAEPVGYKINCRKDTE